MRQTLDLTARKSDGESVKSKDIKKHKNDIFRLTAAYTPDPISDIPESIREDLNRFLEAVSGETIDFKSLGLGRRKRDEVFAILRGKYGL